MTILKALRIQEKNRFREFKYPLSLAETATHIPNSLLTLQAKVSPKVARDRFTVPASYRSVP